MNNNLDSDDDKTTNVVELREIADWFTNLDIEWDEVFEYLAKPKNRLNITTS